MALFGNKSGKSDVKEFGSIVTLSARHKGGLNILHDTLIKIHGCQDKLIFDTTRNDYMLPYSRIIAIGKYDVLDEYKDLIKIDYINSYNHPSQLIFASNYDSNFIETVQKLIDETKVHENGLIVI